MYIQLVPPNLAQLGNVGWCLAFVEDAYRTPHSFATATDAWNATRLPHRDRNFSQDVMFPVWFSYYENGFNFGHVAIYVPGRGILSSPYKADNSQQWFKDVDECARVLNCVYLGWSEDLAGVLLIKEQEMPTQEQTLAEFRYWNVPDPSQQQLDYYSAHPWSVLYYDLGRYNFDRRKELEAGSTAKFKAVDQTLYEKLS